MENAVILKITNVAYQFYGNFLIVVQIFAWKLKQSYNTTSVINPLKSQKEYSFR